MYTAVLWVFVLEALTTKWFLQVYVLTMLLLPLCEYAICWWITKRDNMSTPLNTLSISTIVPFIQNYCDFLNWGFRQPGIPYSGFDWNAHHLTPIYYAAQILIS